MPSVPKKRRVIELPSARYEPLKKSGSSAVIACERRRLVLTGGAAQRRGALFVGDAAALHGRLDELLSLPAADRRALGAAARRAVEARLSWRRVEERLLEDV
jgi:glycosyltransferase involved in cell wall biosynthesis